MAGMKNFEVLKQMKVGRKNIVNVWKNFQEAHTTSPNPGRKHLVYNKRVIEAVQKSVNVNQQRSMRNMKKELNISERSLQRIMKENLGLKLHKI